LQEESKQFGPRQAIRALKSRWKLGSLIFTGCIVIAVTVAVLYPPQYTSFALIQYDPNAGDELLVERQRSSSSDKAKDQIEFVRGSMFLFANVRNAIDESGLRTTIGMSLDPASHGMVYEHLHEELMDDVLVQAISTNLIRVAYTCDDREVAFLIVDELVTGFLDGVFQRKRNQAKDSRTFILREQDKSRRHLSRIDKNITEFRKKYDQYLYDSPRNHLVNYERNKERLEELRIELKTQEERLAFFEKRESDRNEYLSAHPPEEDMDPFLAKLRGILEGTKLALTEANAQFLKPDAPTVKALQDRIEVLEKSIKKEEERIAEEAGTYEGEEDAQLISGDQQLERIQIQKLEAQLAVGALTANIEFLEDRLEELSSAVEQMPARQRQYNEHLRGYDGHKSQYDELVRQLAEAELLSSVSESHDASVYRQIIGARRSLLRDLSTPIKMALGGIFFGILLGFSAMLGLEYADRSFADIDEARAFLRLPSLGMIPNIRTPDEVARKRRRIIVGWITIAIVVAVVVLTFVLHSGLREWLQGMWQRAEFFFKRTF